MREPMVLQFKVKDLEPTSDIFEGAPCKNYSSWFIPREGHLTRREKDQVHLAAAMCESCPAAAFAACRDNASEEDFRVTVRAGQLPGIVKHGRPKNQIINGFCHRGHDTTVMGLSDGGECRECRITRETALRRANGVAPRKLTTPPLTDEEVASGLCAQGHDVSAPEDRSRYRQCRSCVADYKRQHSKDRWAKTRNTGEGKGAKQREKTHCPAGHEYTKENTYRRVKIKDGNVSESRECRACKRERDRGRYGSAGSLELLDTHDVGEVSTSVPSLEGC